MYKTKVTIDIAFITPFGFDDKLAEISNGLAELAELTETDLGGGQTLHERPWPTRESADAWCAWALEQEGVVSAVVEEVV